MTRLEYETDGYTLLKGLVPREVANALLHQIDRDMEVAGTPLLSRTGMHGLLKRPAIELYGFHYPPLLGLLWGLTPTIASATGHDLLPSYSYFRIYREGDVCRVHSDRPSCEHSVSLTLDYSDGVPWDLEIGMEHVQPGPTVADSFEGKPFRSIAMEPGDGLLYQGVNRRHGRMTPNANAWSAHLFLHWVDRAGPHAEHAFDGNLALARPFNLPAAVRPDV